jgi:hypothetical protein
MVGDGWRRCHWFGIAMITTREVEPWRLVLSEKKGTRLILLSPRGKKFAVKTCSKGAFLREIIE